MQSLKKQHKSRLQDIFPGDQFTDAPEALCPFGTDASRLADTPWAVVRPETEAQVVQFMRLAHQERIPVITRARGTNVVGACVPTGGGVVLSTLRMNNIIDIDEQDFVAEVESGVVTGDLQKQLTRKGLMYPPDPASYRISTIGGNIATGAGGMRAVKYGVTRDYVLGVRAVLPGGEILDSGGRSHKNVVGLDLPRLFVGSEGTLGVMTKVTLKLLPKPEQTASILACWETTQQALDAASALFRAGILPVAMEFMAEDVLKALSLATKVPWPQTTAAALLLRVDGSQDALQADIDRLENVIAETSPSYTAKGASAHEEPLWEVRRLISPASFKLAPDKMSDDVSVPRSKVAPAVDGIRDIAQRAGLPILVFGHLGDGNLHVNIMFDKSAGQQSAAATAKKDVLSLVLSLGGTMSGEHGVGLTKLPYIDKQLSPVARRLMQGIRNTFDPHGILNPGKAY